MSGKTTSEVGAALRRSYGSLTMIGGFSLVINLLVLASPLYMMQVYDRVLASRSHETLVALTVLVVGLLAIMGVLELIRRRIMVRVGVQVDRRLNQRVFRAVADDARLRADASSDSALRDLRTFREFLAGSGPFALFDTPWVPIYLAVIFILHPILGYVATAGALLLFAVGALNELCTRRPMALAAARARDSERLAGAGRRNAEVLKAMGMVTGLQRRWLAKHAEALHFQGKASDRAGTMTSASKALRLILQAAILGSGAALVIEQELSAGAMIAASIILARALAPVEQAIGNWRSFLSARAAYGRLSELLTAHPEPTAPMRLPAAQARLEVQGLVAGPPDATKPSLTGIGFHLAAGQALAVLGPSAAGKSTLARLLVGVWSPQHGRVRLDGVALDQWHPDDLGRQIGYLPQDVELFAGSVSDNIARFGADPNPDDIIAAARAADAHEMILTLPDGYNTTIGDGGNRLSAGQRQRLALARALYGDPFLVVLDEPNASLDAEGERALTKAIAGAKERGRIVIVMAHRPSAIAAADFLLVLKAGRQEAYGPRDEVLRSATQNGAQIARNVTPLSPRKVS